MWQTFLIVIAILLTPAVCNSQEMQPKPANLEQIRATVKKLSNENEQLRRKVADLERRLQLNSVRDRLTREEQRGEDLQIQLIGLAEQEARLQSQLEDVNEQLRPEYIDNIQVYGSLRPEQVRESTRRRLSNEQTRIQSQLELLNQSKVRLQSSISVTDMLIQNLRLQLQNVATP